MTLAIKDQVENSLRAINYHPDCVQQADEELRTRIERLHAANCLPSAKQEVYSYTYDAVLMQEKYFRARVAFLSRLIQLLGDRSEPIVHVAEDGCGSGVDLHVVQDLLAERVVLTGIDHNPVSRQRAKLRVPTATVIDDFNEQTYNVIYADFVSIDNNLPWEWNTRGQKSYNALRPKGLVLQNSDMQKIHFYLQFFARMFNRCMQPELLAKIESAPDCYLCRFEKD